LGKKMGARSAMGLLFVALGMAGASGAVGDAQTCTQEPNVETAMTWFPPQRGVWTPLGWKDHLFRFTSVYNGTLLCAPSGQMAKPHIKDYEKQNFQLNFTPSSNGALPPVPQQAIPLYKLDGGVGIQRWREDKNAPVLQTDWRMADGLILRQEVFTHLKGGQDIKIGTEPLYAWVRLSVAYVDPITYPDKYYFGVQLSNLYDRVFYPFGLDDSVTLNADPVTIKLDNPLTSETLSADGGEGNGGLQVLEPDGRVRLAVLPGGAGPVSLEETTSGSRVYHLKVELPVKVGAHTDMLVPMLPEDAQEFTREVSLGRDGALAECEAYWSKVPATAAVIHTPENYINQAIRRNLQFAQIITERNPDTGEYAFLSGSFGYDALWSTPTSMIAHMFLDLLGYHDVVAKHVELYRKNQGSVKPPGPYFEKHPGYFSTPKTLTSYDWLTDHAAVMEMLSRHALLSGDRDFAKSWLEPLLKACDFIEDSCKMTDHPGVKGLLPPGVANDTLQPVQGIWTQAWTYKALASTVMLLKEMKQPRAAELDSFTQNYKKLFQDGFREETAKQPTWTDDNGKTHHVLPQNLTPPPPHHIFDEAFRLDGGPLCLPWSGLLDAHDPEMIAFGDYFRVGPPAKLWGPRSSPIARACLHRELSSCEPCYSWNIVNSWQTGDRDRFLEGMYALFTSAISPQTYINGEHRNAMYGTVFVAPLMTWCMRHAVIDEEIVPGELHLLRLCPLAWISSSEETVFEKMPTLYGPVNLKWKLSEDGKNLNVTFSGNWREKPGKIILHTPPMPGLYGITINSHAEPAAAQIEVKL